MKTIPSILFPDKRGYHIQSSGTDNWAKRGNAPLLMGVTVFDTFGDGLTQHSGDWCPQWGPDFTDVCVSLATAVMAEPADQIWNSLFMCTDGGMSDTDIRWALTVKYSEKVLRFYSASERKVTSADKRHDRRYERVEVWCDGTPEAAFQLLMKDRSHHDWITRLLIADRIQKIWREQSEDCGSRMEKIFSPIKDLPKDWECALEAVRCAIEVVDNIGHTKRMLRHLTPKSEEVAA